MNNPFIHELFTQTATTDPNAIAVEHLDDQYPYRFLEQQGNRLANWLLENGATKGDPVVLLLDNSVDVIIAILGCLKAGCLFVPLNPRLPKAPLTQMVNQVNPKFMLVEPTHIDMADTLAPPPCRLAFPWRHHKDYDQAAAPGLMNLADTAPSVHWEPNDPCYIYFTSGSTGVPKGVTGRMRAIAHFIQWEIDTFQIHKGCRVSQLTTPGFDAFLRDMFVPLIAGGTVCVPDNAETVLDGGKLVAWLSAKRIEVIHCVPSLFRQLLKAEPSSKQLPDLKLVMLSGEVVHPADVGRCHDLLGSQVRLINFYGPTETTMIKFFYEISPTDRHRESIPIGKPMRGARGIIMNAAGQVCSAGQVGEIYIRTPFRSLGYWQQPALTDQVFVANPVSGNPEDIVYKTGDQGRLLEDGNFAFLGRTDHMVKLHGVRVELGEIERALASFPGIHECAVTLRNDLNPKDKDDARLIAYLVSHDNDALSLDKLRAHLSDKLPELMVPMFVPMETLPKTSTGKVDRKALPRPKGLVLRPPYVAPRTQTEVHLAEIWCNVLNEENVGLYDNFFALGGDSITMIQVVSAARSRALPFPTQWIFESQTIEALATRIDAQSPLADGAMTTPESPSETSLPRLFPALNMDQAEFEQLVKGLPGKEDQENIAAITPITAMQHGMLFHTLEAQGTGLYVVQIACDLSADIDLDLFTQTWERVIDRFDVFRASYVRLDTSQPLMVVRKKVTIPWFEKDLRNHPEEEREAAYDLYRLEDRIEPFELAAAPLMRLTLLRMSDDTYRFLWTHHHTCTDGWSVPNIFKALTSIYTDLAAHRQPDPTPAPAYTGYIYWLHKQDETAAEQFWREYLAGLREPTRFANDTGSSSNKAATAQKLRISLSEALTEQIRDLARAKHITANIITQAAWSLLLKRHSGNQDVTFGCVVSGRPPELDGVANMVGPFINTITVRTNVNPNTTVGAWLTDQMRIQGKRDQFGHTPLVRVKQYSEMPASDPLFVYLYQFQNFPVGDALVEGATSNLISNLHQYDYNNYPLTLVISTHHGLQVELMYNADRFDKPFIAALLAQYRLLLTHLVTLWDETISALEDKTELAMARARKRKEQELKGRGRNRLRGIRRKTITV